MIAVCSLSGAPGVTTLALALAGVWPGPEPVRVVEADSSGGDLAMRWRLPPWPGLVDLAAAARPGQDHETSSMAAAVQVLPGGVRVCVAPSTADRSAGALELLAANPKALEVQGEVTVVDLGRVAPGTDAASTILLESADAVVLVTSGEPAHLKRVKEAAGELFVLAPRVGLAVVDTDRRPKEIVEALRLPVWARVPHDPKTAAFVNGRAHPLRTHRRRLFVAARTLAHQLHETSARDRVVR